MRPRDAAPGGASHPESTDATSPWGLPLFAALLLLVLAAAFVFDHDAWTPDEPRVIELARSVGDGPRAVPRLCGRPFLEQPPLYYWTVGLAYRALGQSVGIARAVSSLFAGLTLLVTFGFTAHLAGRRAGALAALALGTSGLFFWTGHRVVVDSALGFFVACSALAALRGLTIERAGTRRAGLLLSYVAATLAYLVKGVVGIGLSGFAFLGVVAARREPRALLRAHLWAGALIFLAITTPYHWGVYREGGEAALHTLLVVNTLERSLGDPGTVAHARPWFYYLGTFPVGFLPSTLFLAGAAARFARRRKALAPDRRFAYEMPLWWLGLGLLALSLATTKRELYLMPLLPAAAALTGTWLDEALFGRPADRYARGVIRGLAAAAAVLALALPVGALGLHLRRVAAWLPDGLALTVPLGLPVLAGLLGVGSSLTCWRLLRRDRTPLALAALITGSALMLLLGGAAVVPTIDAQKRLGPFLSETAANIPEGRPLYVLQPDETACGAIAFFTGRTPAPLADRADLERHLAREREIFAIVIDKRKNQPLFRSVADLEPEVLLALVRPLSRSLRLLRFASDAESVEKWDP